MRKLSTNSSSGRVQVGGGQLKLTQVDEDDFDAELTSDPDPSHECSACGVKLDVDSTRTHTPNWCSVCEQVRTFVRLDFPSDD